MTVTAPAPTTPSDAALIAAGAVVPGTVEAGDDRDTIARHYTHPALDDRVVVRLVPAVLGVAEDLTCKYLGFDAPVSTTGVGTGKRSALGFPAWALVHDPANGHHALNLVKDVERLARTAKSKAGAAKDGFTALGDMLAGPRRTSCPRSTSRRAGSSLEHGNTTYAATMFGKAREAEEVHDLISRRDLPAVYEALLTAVGPALDGMLLQRLRDASPHPGAHQQVRLVVPLRHPGMTETIDTVLSALDAPHCFRYSMIRSALSSCLVYVSYGGILIRPVVPPTWETSLFSGARQRVYLSATLGNGGELERSFGRPAIRRLALPASAPTPRSGRRYFVFPDLALGADPVELTRSIVALAGKALVLAPDTDTAVSRAQGLAQPGWPVLTKDNIENGMEAFGALSNATCGLAARYDGLDLPGDACHAVVPEGKPDQDTLQERFLSERVRAGSALAERIRTRVVQGAGRCTRGPNDWALVVVLGPDLTKYLLSPDTWQALDPELQAEIQFGIRNSRDTAANEVMDNVKVFLAQAEEWRQGAEPLLLKYRQSAVRALPEGTAALAKAVTLEVEASGFAGAGRWADASRCAQEVARELDAGGAATRGYQALWLYLAGVWADQAGVDSGAPGCDAPPGNW